MNVQWRKLGSLCLAASAAFAIGLSVSTAWAQSAERTADGWHDRSNEADNAEADADAGPSQAASDRPVRPAESPRAGSPGFAPAYQQPQGDPNRPAAVARPSNAPTNWQPSAQPRNAQYNDNRQPPRNAQYTDNRQQPRSNYQRQDYPAPAPGSTAGPYYGYPPARARTVSYNRQDVEYVDDQPQGPGPVMMHGGSMGPGEMHAGQPMMSGPVEYGGQEPGGCGCANGNCGADGCTGGCDGGCDCGAPNCWPRNACRVWGDWWKQEAFRDFEVYAGVQGFKGPIDLGENGDFGFHEGANWGMPLWGCSGIGFQIGGEIDHSDFAPNATVFGDHRTQYYVTGGVFYRPTRECGWQGGLVWDYLDDEFYDSITVGQVRGNLSYVIDWSEFGFEFATQVHSDTHEAPVGTVATLATIYRPVDLYELYYGRRLANGGQAKGFIGVADGLGAIVGANLDIAISDSFSLEGEFAYIIADKVAAGSIPGETANIAFSVVWHPGCHARDTFDSAYRPLFNVADNSTFIVNRRNP